MSEENGAAGERRDEMLAGQRSEAIDQSINQPFLSKYHNPFDTFLD